MPPRRINREEREAEARAAEEQRVREIVQREIAAREADIREQLAQELDIAGFGQNGQADVHQAMSGLIDDNNNASDPHVLNHGEPDRFQSIQVLHAASPEVINGLLENHGVKDIPLPAAAMEKLRRIIRTIGAMMDLNIDFECLTVMEARTLRPPPHG